MKKRIYVNSYVQDGCVEGYSINLRLSKLHFSKEEWDKIDLTNKMIEIDFPELDY